MTTAREVKKLVAPLLARHDDLVLHGRFIIIKPIGHVLRSLFIDATGSKNRFSPMYHAFGMFEPDVGGLGCFGDRIGTGHKLDGWYLDAPHVSELLIEHIEAVALPSLRSIVSIRDYAEFAQNGPFYTAKLDFHVQCKLPVDIALGDLDAAQDSLIKLSQRRRWYENDKCVEFLDMIDALGPLVEARDRKGLAAWLHAREAETVRNRKLMPYWEPSPFPIEEM